MLVDGGERVAVSTLHGRTLQFVDATTGDTTEPLDLGQSPMGMALSPDGETLWVAVSDDDALVGVSVATGAEVVRVPVTGGDLVGPDGEPLPRSNPNDVAISLDGTRLYVTRGADNAVSVFDVEGPTWLGEFPTTWYPTGIVPAPAGDRYVVLEGRGFGGSSDTDPARRDTMDGNVSVVAPGSLDLDETTALARANLTRAQEVFPFECDGFFPIPTRPGMRSPIEHVILVVKENKTFDCVFGDLTDIDVDVDPSLLRWGEEITPNQHAIARQFALSDNFFVESENSDMGHLMLTSGILTDFIERVWFEAKRHGSDFLGYQVDTQSVPSSGNLFTHLMDHGVEFTVYGEIVGMLAHAADGRQPMVFSDIDYPGGPFYNMNVRDSERGEYVVEQIEAGNLAPFTFMLLPNDHTGGVAPGNPTPESEVADNDEGVGILLAGLSRTPYWEKTVVIVLEDDPQGCDDHVETHRSFLMVASPWARREYVSHVNATFDAVFATIFRILDVPPMGRHDASAVPLWDMFTGTPDYTPYDLIPRNVPEEKILDPNTPGAERSMRMDFRGPDRNTDMGLVLDNYRLWRMGRLTRDEAQARIDAGIRSIPAIGDHDPDEYREERDEELREEADEEYTAFDEAMTAYARYLRERGEAAPAITGAPLDEETITGVMSGRIAPEDVARIERAPMLPSERLERFTSPGRTAR